MKMREFRHPFDVVREAPATRRLCRERRASAATIATLTLALCISTAHAQTGKLGSYAGTIKVSGSEISPKVTYRASAKVSLPVSERKDSSISAEFLAGEAPNAIVTITQWDSSYTEKSADSDGKFSSWSCTLAAPVDIPMTATGVLDVDLKTKKHALSLTLLATKEVAFNCVNSRSGPYKKKQGIALYIGTGAPGAQSETQLPFTDPARLAASYTLMPTAATKQKYGPIMQEWDLRLLR
jgi:hypothetical protein